MNKIKRVVIKIGSSSVVKNNSFNVDFISLLSNQIKKLKNNNIDVIIVSSGAIALGCRSLNLPKPKKMSMKQAFAAVGQVRLIEGYEELFDKDNLKVAQILLSHDDFENRTKLTNFKNTINEVLNLNIVPIINENDAVSIKEIKVGDNDTLSALVASSIDANLLILISDIEGLYNKNPNEEDAILIKEVNKITKEIESYAKGTKSNVGTGGMITKIKAAKIVVKSNCDMSIIHNKEVSNLYDLVINRKDIGTYFYSSNKKTKSKERWMLFNTQSKGIICIDEGAKVALFNRKSLLPKGITNVIGNFKKNDLIDIKNNKVLIAKGITNYSSDEIIKIKGKESNLIKDLLNYDGKKEVIHANNLTIIGDDLND